MLQYNDQSCVPITKWWFLLMCVVFRVRIPEHRHNTSTRPLAPHTPHCARHTTNMKLHLPLEVYNSDNTEEINLLRREQPYPNKCTKRLSMFTWVTCLPTGHARFWHRELDFLLHCLPSLVLCWTSFKRFKHTQMSSNKRASDKGKEREDQKNDLQPWLWLSFH